VILVPIYLRTVKVPSSNGNVPVGITAQEKKSKPPGTGVQEVASGDAKQRVFVIDSEQRRQYEQGKRQRRRHCRRSKTIRQVTFKLNGEQRSGVSAASARAHPVLQALGISSFRPPAPPAGAETVM
jgi:hypothetical protein